MNVTFWTASVTAFMCSSRGCSQQQHVWHLCNDVESIACQLTCSLQLGLVKLRTTTRYDCCWSAPPLTLRLSTLQRNANRPCCLTCSATTRVHTCRLLCKQGVSSQHSQGPRRICVIRRTSRVISLASSANSCDWLPGNENKIAGVCPTCIRPASMLVISDDPPLQCEAHYAAVHTFRSLSAVDEPDPCRSTAATVLSVSAGASSRTSAVVSASEFGSKVALPGQRQQR